MVTWKAGTSDKIQIIESSVRYGQAGRPLLSSHSHMPSFFSTLSSTSQFEISSFWTNTHLTTGVNSHPMNKSKLAGSSTHPSFHENPYLNSSHHFSNINIPNKKSEIRTNQHQLTQDQFSKSTHSKTTNSISIPILHFTGNRKPGKMKSPAAIAILLLVLVNSVSGFPNFPPKNISSPPWASNILPKNISSSPWASFQNLTGCHMGDHVPGLVDLKRYFERFGYMNFPDTATNSTNANVTDEFDDSLEWAIKTYQKNFNLNPTGSLDTSTVNQIVRPRCGVPDIINGSTTMNSSGAAHANDRRLYSFFPGSPSWPSNKRQLTYAISPTARISADDATLRSIFARAFERWANVTQMTFAEAAEYSAADIKIGFYSGDHGDGEAFDGVLGTLAHAFSPTNGRFHLDAAENWAVDGSLPSVGEIDLESVAVHEIGHLLGLGHSSVEEAIMFPTISSGTRRVELAADDVAGVQWLYGANPSYNASQSSSNSAQEEERGGAASGGGRVVALGFFSGAVSAIVSLLIL